MGATPKVATGLYKIQRMSKMLAPKNETQRLIDADLGDHSDNPESYAAMSTEALNMAHCCDAFLNSAKGFIPIRLVEENREDNMASRSRSEIFAIAIGNHGDHALPHKAYVEM